MAHASFYLMKSTIFRGNERWAPAVAAALLGLSAAGPARAGLAWEKERIELSPGIGESVIRTGYSFKNTGTEPVSVLAIKPSCGCVATNLEKFQYAPGESGTLKVTYDAEMDKDEPLQERTIKIVTSDEPEHPKVLQLSVHVREAVTVSPEGVVWPHGEPGKPREVVVKPGVDIKSIHLVQTGENDNFAVDLKREGEGESYRMTITPKNTDAPSYATLVFDVTSPSFPRTVSCEVRLQVD